MDSTSQIIKALHQEVAQLLASKNDDNSIIDTLISNGYDRSYAETILQNVRADQSDRGQFYKHLFGGLFVFLSGAAITWGSYTMAAPGGMFFVFTGIMLYGLFAIIRAIIIFRK